VRDDGDSEDQMWSDVDRSAGSGRRHGLVAMAVAGVVLLGLFVVAVVALRRDDAAGPRPAPPAGSTTFSQPALIKPGQLFGDVGLKRSAGGFVVVLPACYSGTSTGVAITTSDLDKVLWATATATATSPPLSLASGFALGEVPPGFAPGTTIVAHADSLAELPDEFGIAVGSDKGAVFFGVFEKTALASVADGEVLVNSKTYPPDVFASNGRC